MKVFGFSKKELWMLAIVFFVLTVLVYSNLIDATRKRRDSQRKQSVRYITDALAMYQKDFGSFPLSSSDGRIIACLPEPQDAETVKDELGNPIYGPCEWGWDAFGDVYDSSYPPYMNKLPTDPSHDAGVRFFYVSNGRRYQVLAALEGTSEAEYDPDIEARGIACGNKICNFGLGFAQTPLDKSLEEYENELNDASKN